ncbi:tRNA uridine-5-carboxymethylaminomethyl(34) synthesis GTPase MnmE [Marinicella sp. W31]|uniref:tRNA uridine-5-carboxymethylaminomethyl(34) synthesis GTPase MnmE n=1 Tax=Marinicella sp. W31 TaxID=3023713 RepID=UPI0037582059
MNHNTDTIAAIATAPGVGGVGIIRISGSQALNIGQQLSGKKPQVRQATVASFTYDSQLIDSGLLLYFQGPASFTGEDVVELQIHGGPVVLNMLLKAVLNSGARMARAGEFSERAFLNDKLDLIQAEAIADVIAGGSEQAVLAAQRSLQGEFSKHIHGVLQQLIETRVWLESAIDFPEEEIDFLSDQELHSKLETLQTSLRHTLEQTQSGIVLNKGIHIALIGIPNAGKSSLLNALTQEDSAIVSPQAGTTRDTVRQDIHIQGIPIRLVDTAGIHQTDDWIEQQGIERAKQEASKADVVLWVIDATVDIETQTPVIAEVEKQSKLIPVINKKDLHTSEIELPATYYQASTISALTGHGIDALQDRIVALVSGGTPIESTFSARTRHLDHLKKTMHHVETAVQHLHDGQGELSAEELRLAQEQLSALTGEFSSDDLLGEIFSSFCIGK